MKHKWKYYHRIWSFSFTEMYLKERPLLDEAIPKLQNCGFRRDNRVWWPRFLLDICGPQLQLTRSKKCTLRIWLTHLPKIGRTFTVIQGVDLVLVFQYYRGMVLFWNWHPTRMEIPDTWANGADIWYSTIMSNNSYMNIEILLSNVIFHRLIFKQASTLMLEYSAKSQIKNATH